MAKIRPLAASNEAARPQLERDLRKYQRGGGKIEVLPAFGLQADRGGVFVAREKDLRQAFADRELRRNLSKAKKRGDLTTEFEDNGEFDE